MGLGGLGCAGDDGGDDGNGGAPSCGLPADAGACGACVADGARVGADEGESCAYLYSFDHGQAWHGDELAYVFGDDDYRIELAKLALGTVDPDLTAATQRYWLKFARSGDPNGDGVPGGRATRARTTRTWCSSRRLPPAVDCAPSTATSGTGTWPRAERPLSAR